MIIKDRIYGSITIDNPLLVDLIQSKPFQRLNHISQDGATHFLQPEFNANRFEHSVGTWYLSHRFDRPIAEQVACLLHDLPHTAFSHVIDFVMEDDNQEYHDRFLKQVVLDSEIPVICGKHGLDIHEVLQKEKYYLLDNRTPNLSFDRWDYVMRDSHMIGILSAEDVERIISRARLHDGKFFFDDLTVASQLCLTSLMICQLGYVGATSHGAWFLLANAIKIALREGILTEQELFGTDEEVWNKLTAAHNKDIDEYLARLQSGKHFVYAPVEDADFHDKNKARYIDPTVLHNDTYQRVSEIVVGLDQYIANFKQSCQYIGVKQLV